LKSIKSDNASLWNESLDLRQRYARQQDTIDKILGFLASIFSSKKPILSSLKNSQTGDKRKLVEVDESSLKKSKVGDELVTTYLQNLVQNPKDDFNDLSSKIGSVAEHTNKVEKDLDILQDHVIDVASLVGIDPDNFMNFHGTDQDRETLLSLMNTNDTLDEIPFSVPESTEKYDTFLADLGEDALQEGI
jgi:chaperonin cofactor prefoldin